MSCSGCGLTSASSLRRIDRGAAAVAEGGDVHRHRLAVHLDRLLDRLGRQRQGAELIGVAEHEHVGADRIAEQRGGQAVRHRRNGCCSRPAWPVIARLSRSVGSEKSALRVKSPGRNSAVLTTTLGVARLDRAQHLLAADDDDVAAEHQVGAAGGDADGVDVVGRVGDADVAVDRAALLREAGHVDDADALAFEMRGHAEDGADGDDAGAADAGDDDAVGVVGRAACWAPAAPAQSAGSATLSPFFSLAPCTVTKDGQKPLTQE